MAVRRDTKNRLFLIRECGTCGKSFSTTADNPFIRQVPRDGKKQATTYYCSQTCYKKSYKHIGWFDGMADKRRKERYAKRDIKEKNRRYYAAHAEEMRERRRRNYHKNIEEERKSNAYYKKKRKLINGQTAS